MEKPLFITLDDTLIFTKSGMKYPVHSKDWILNIDIIEDIKRLYKKGFKILVIDNQDSVEHGYVDIKVFDEKVLEIVQIIENACGIPANEICYMFFTGGRDDYYRLPSPGLAYECALEYELDLPNSVVIGSSDEDYKFSKNIGARAYNDVNGKSIDQYK